VSTHEGNKKGDKPKVLVPSSSPAPDGQGMAVDDEIEPRPSVSLKETLREAKAKRLAEILMKAGTPRE